MSRLLIKNLPTYATPSTLQSHFTQSGNPGGTITDCKVASKPDGTSRRFGFVGYKTPLEAQKAKEWFDRTFIGGSKISVCVVEGAKDAPAPRPNKRRRVDSPPTHDDTDTHASSTKKESKSQLQSNSNTQTTSKDNLESEFMKAMQPRTKKGPAWANDEVPAPVAAVVPPDNEAQQEADGDGDTQMKEPEPEAEARDEAISDLEWMRRRMGNSSTVDEKAFEQSDDEDGAPHSTTKISVKDTDPKPTTEPEPPQEEKQDPTVETILSTSRLFVRNLAFSCSEEELVELFSPFGELVQVHIPHDITTTQAKGVAYITFKSPSCAVAAYTALDRTSFQGRLIHILGAVDRRNKAVDGEDGEERKKSVKEEKQAKRKAMAGREFNWGMLYMNSDAVASSIADRLNIDKAAILNPEESSGANPAVKLALAETHIISETKAYLESHGVDITSFTPRAPRSDTTILVKNIPYGTSAEQIQELFEPYAEEGGLKRVLVPPAGTMAVVEYARADEAMKGFKAVAYRRLGNSVVYLEKAPAGVFLEGASVESDKGPAPSYVGGKRIPEQDGGEDGAPDDADAGEQSIAGGATLYVKNLAFSTTQERLTKTFRHLPSFAFARVQTKPDPKRPEARLSMGYGFIGFKDPESARKAMGSLQGFVLDGHSLSVKFAARGADEETGKGKEKSVGGKRTTKMIVKNVPFEATKKDIQALFGSHGSLKSVRLPRKFDHRTRGFAFLDFVSRAEAENAYAALRHTHLLGRHLVLEWAEEGEQDVEALRKKAGVGYGDGKFVPGRKRKIDMGKTGEEDVEDLDV
ncbi:hypothetical protein H0H92_007834 [Tricholoma furcatifolium]|nr:hypothetical protein H0H92_007834 [Tricholoma furcatifolium]